MRTLCGGARARVSDRGPPGQCSKGIRTDANDTCLYRREERERRLCTEEAREELWLWRTEGWRAFYRRTKDPAWFAGGGRKIFPITRETITSAYRAAS